MNIGEKFVNSNHCLITTIASNQNDCVQYALEGSVFVGGALIQWLRDEMRFIVDASDTEYFAKKVKDNINNTNYTIDINEIKFNQLKCDLKDLTKEQRKCVKNSLDYINDVYKQCYTYSIKYDKGEVLGTVVSSGLNTLNGNIKVENSRLDSINSVSATTFTLNLKNAYVAMSNQIDSAVLKVIEGSSANKDLKYLATSIAIIKYNLYTQLSSI